MSKESDLIYQAEMKRVMDPAREAIENAQQNASIPLEELAHLSSEEMIDVMRLWRIWAVTLMTLHKKEWNGKRAAEYLYEAREVFRTYYYNPTVLEAASAMKTDPEGNEYQMLAEMNRDQGKFYLYAAGLTGESFLTAIACQCFEEAIKNAEEGTSAWAVATMEREIAGKKIKQEIDFDIFREAYETAVYLSPRAGGWDRMAAVSWWYVKESLWAGRKSDLELGLRNLRKASQELGINWLKKYPLNEVSITLLGVSRRITARW